MFLIVLSARVAIIILNFKEDEVENLVRDEVAWESQTQVHMCVVRIRGLNWRGMGHEGGAGYNKMPG